MANSDFQERSFSWLSFVSRKMAGNRTQRSEVGVKCVSRPGLDRADERAAQQDFPRLHGRAMRGEFVDQPGDRVGGVAENAGRNAGLLDLSVAQAEPRDPSKVYVGGTERSAAGDQCCVTGVVADAIDDGTRLLRP